MTATPMESAPSKWKYTVGEMSLVGYAIRKDSGLDVIVDRLRDIRTSVAVQAVDAELVGIEGLAFNASGASAAQAPALWFSVVEALLHDKSPDQIIAVPPTSIKKCITGTGRADKQAVIESVIEWCPEVEERLMACPIHKRHNLSDAIAAAISAHQKLIGLL